ANDAATLSVSAIGLPAYDVTVNVIDSGSTSPDLTVSSVTVTPPSGNAGTPATLTVTIKNGGKIAANNFTLSSWFDRSTAASCSQTGSVNTFVSSLAPGATATFAYPFLFGSNIGTHSAKAFVDSTCVVAEVSESNNQRSATYFVHAPDLVVSAI